MFHNTLSGVNFVYIIMPPLCEDMTKRKVSMYWTLLRFDANEVNQYRSKIELGLQALEGSKDLLTGRKKKKEGQRYSTIMK